ncbi:MAG: hypothetical protein ACRDP8_22805 [Actinopolymorphaceae bacterium]
MVQQAGVRRLHFRLEKNAGVQRLALAQRPGRKAAGGDAVPAADLRRLEEDVKTGRGDGAFGAARSSSGKSYHKAYRDVYPSELRHGDSRSPARGGPARMT